MKISSSIILIIVLISCKNMSKEIIFRATNETGEKIEIYKDLKFSIFKNDKITSKGIARIV